MSPLETLRAELIRHGLPRHYVHRTCQEFATHLDESIADLRQAGFPADVARATALERLGCPVSLARCLYRQQAASSVWVRRPLFVSFSLALAVFLVLGVVQLLAFAALWRSLPVESLAAAQHAAKMCLPLLGGAILYPLFNRRFGHQRWFGLAVALVTVLSFTSVIRLTPLADGHVVATLRLVP